MVFREPLSTGVLVDSLGCHATGPPQGRHRAASRCGTLLTAFHYSAGLAFSSLRLYQNGTASWPLRRSARQRQAGVSANEAELPAQTKHRQCFAVESLHRPSARLVLIRLCWISHILPGRLSTNPSPWTKVLMRSLPTRFALTYRQLNHRARNTDGASLGSAPVVRETTTAVAETGDVTAVMARAMASER